MDEGRVQPRQLGVVEPESGEPAGPEVLDEDVAARDQATQDLGPLRAPQVEPDAALVPIDGEEVGGRPRAGRLLPDPRRPPAAGRVALGRLDLDDVGAEVAQEHRAVRPGEDRRAVDDPKAGERPGRGGSVGVADIAPMVAPRILAT